jgi:hypothetical protein
MAAIDHILDVTIAAVIVPHGLTDLWIHGGSLVAPYTIVGAACVFTPMLMLQAASLAASIIHFGKDTSNIISFILVTVLLILFLFGRERIARGLLVVYMLAIHLPQHYNNTLGNTPISGILALITLGIGMVAIEPMKLVEKYNIGQRLAIWLVIAHTLVNV